MLYPIMSENEGSDPILKVAKESTKKLRAKWAYTNTVTLDLRCEERMRSSLASSLFLLLLTDTVSSRYVRS